MSTNLGVCQGSRDPSHADTKRQQDRIRTRWYSLPFEKQMTANYHQCSAFFFYHFDKCCRDHFTVIHIMCYLKIYLFLTVAQYFTVYCDSKLVFLFVSLSCKLTCRSCTKYLWGIAAQCFFFALKRKHKCK